MLFEGEFESKGCGILQGVCVRRNDDAVSVLRAACYNNAAGYGVFWYI